jgi:hypothetical protein
VHVQDVDPPRVDEAEHGREREGVELAALEIRNVDAEVLRAFLPTGLSFEG